MCNVTCLNSLCKIKIFKCDESIQQPIIHLFLKHVFILTICIMLVFSNVYYYAYLVEIVRNATLWHLWKRFLHQSRHLQPFDNVREMRRFWDKLPLYKHGILGNAEGFGSCFHLGHVHQLAYVFLHFNLCVWKRIRAENVQMF